MIPKLFSKKDEKDHDLKKEIMMYISICGVSKNTHYYGNILVRPSIDDLADLYYVDRSEVILVLEDMGFSVGFADA